MKNWKTTLAGILTAMPQVLHLLFPKAVTIETATALSLLFAALGFTQSKDYNVTGGTTVNVPNDASAVKSAAKTDKP